MSAAGRDAARRIERAQVQASARAERGARDDRRAGARDRGAGVRRRTARRPSPTRGTRAAREQRAGAPLWQLVDFRDDVAPDDRAGIEAALEAAGILDGWVDPVRRAARPGHRGRAARRHRRSASRVPGWPTRSCRRSVTPPACPRRTCAGSSPRSASARATRPVWVSGAGRFRNGVLRGAWHKPAAAYIGHARARGGSARTARRAASSAPPPRAPSSPRIEQQLDELTRRQAQLERELTELPADTEVRDADSALRHRRGRARRARTAARRCSVARTAGAGRRAGGRRHAARRRRRSRPAARRRRAGGGRGGTRPPARIARRAVAGARPGAGVLRRRARARWRTCARPAPSAPSWPGGSQRPSASSRAAVERRDTLQATAGAAIAELEHRLGEVARRARRQRGGAARHRGATRRRPARRRRRRGPARRAPPAARGRDRVATERRRRRCAGSPPPA